MAVSLKFHRMHCLYVEISVFKTYTVLLFFYCFKYLGCLDFTESLLEQGWNLDTVKMDKQQEGTMPQSAMFDIVFDSTGRVSTKKEGKEFIYFKRL